MFVYIQSVPRKSIGAKPFILTSEIMLLSAIVHLRVHSLIFAVVNTKKYEKVSKT